MKKVGNWPIVIVKSDDYYFNGGYIPSLSELEKVKYLVDEYLKLSQDEIDNINKEVDDYHYNEQLRMNSECENKTNEFVDSNGYIYIYKQGDNIKIGKSKRKDCRFKKYVTENPNEIELIFRAYVNNYNRAEIDLHKIFDDFRINKDREWFKFEGNALNLFNTLEDSDWGKKYINK